MRHASLPGTWHASVQEHDLHIVATGTQITAIESLPYLPGAPARTASATTFHAKRIPAAAKVNSYTVVEQAGIIFMWHDEEGLEPDFKLPRCQWTTSLCSWSSIIWPAQHPRAGSARQ